MKKENNLMFVRIHAIVLLCTVMSFLFGPVGCTTLREYRVDSEEPFPGVRQLMAAYGGVDLVFVHGMGGYSEGDPDQITDHLAAELSLIENVANVSQLSSSARRRVFEDASGNMKLRSYTLRWSDLTFFPKAVLRSTDVSDERLALHDQVKQSLMNSNLADAVIYLGSFKSEIQARVRSDLTSVLNDAGGQERPIVLVSFSLGSKILLDVVDQMRDGGGEDKRLADTFADRSSVFFMLANQIPLLELGELEPRGVAKEAASSPVQDAASIYKTVIKFMDRKSATGIKSQQSLVNLPPFKIVAISDPNDFLSYPIPDAIANRYPDTFVNITLSVSQRGYMIPFVGTVTNPTTAHTGFGRHKRVRSLILDGTITR